MNAPARNGSFGRPSLPTLRGLPPGRAPASMDDDDECADEKSGVSLIASPRPRALRRPNHRLYRKPAFEANDNDRVVLEEEASATVTEWLPRTAAIAEIAWAEVTWAEVDVSDLDGATFVDMEPPSFLEEDPIAVVETAVAPVIESQVVVSAPPAPSFLSDVARGMGYGLALAAALAGAGAAVIALLM